LTLGYHAAFTVAAIFAVLAALVAAWLPSAPAETQKEAGWATP
jgi:hypothetical protein